MVLISLRGGRCHAGQGYLNSPFVIHLQKFLSSLCLPPYDNLSAACRVAPRDSFELWSGRLLIGSRSPTPCVRPSVTVAHHKFRFQLEGEKSQGTSLQREIQGLQESVVELQKKTEKLQHDLGSKETQNNWLQV